MNNIKWQHCPAPFDGELEEIEEYKKRNKQLDFVEDEEDIEFTKGYAKGIITPIGILPVNDNYNPYDFWIGHTNFSITFNISGIISTIHGVELFIPLSRYRFKIAFGKFFSEDNKRAEIKAEIQKKIEEYQRLFSKR